MVGHGRPLSSARHISLRLANQFVLLVVVLLVAFGGPTLLVAGAEEVSLRLRISWDSRDTYQQWQGTVSLPGGQISNPAPLGIEADEPGSMWIESGQLVISQASLRAYDAVDVDVTGPADAVLVINLSSPNAPPDPTAPITSVPPVTLQSPMTLSQSIRLGDLVDGPWQELSDDQPYRLDVRRVPGDQLRVRLERPHLVFSPGEKLQFTVEPHLLGVADGTSIQLDLEMRGARGGSRALWSTRADRTIGVATDPVEVEPVEVDLNVPTTEGAYEIQIAASHRRFAQRFGAVTVAKRTVQFVVVDDGPRTASTESTDVQWDVVDELDPSSSNWWQKLNASILKNGRNAPMSSGHSRVADHSLGTVLEVSAGGHDNEPPWEAFRLAVRRPGLPHIVEVQYPSDAAQTLGISIVEPNAAGNVVPIGLDSGVYTDSDSLDAPSHWDTHRLVFWPKTKSPLLLLTNRDEHHPARFGRIRLLGGVDQLPVRSPLEPIATERLIAGHMARPLLCENFSARETLDPNSGRSLKDWVTFLEGGKRLIEYLRYAGYNGLSIAVAADGSTIYPSTVLEATPRYDNGVFFSTGQDVVRKDVLEMLFRLFDRENMRLVPVVQFSTRLPVLEQRLHGGDAASRSLLPLREDGLSWLEAHPTRRGLAPHYNPLHPHVQEAMIGVVAELGDRYAHHLSFAGAGVELASDSFSLLPGANWGVDATTISRFVAETGVAADKRQASAMTAEVVLADHRQAWLQWRAEVIAAMYGRMADRLSGTNRAARLYLGGTQLFDNDELRKQLLPALTGSQRHDDVLADLGIIPAAFDHAGVVLLRPHWISPDRSAGFQSLYAEANESKEMDDAFAGDAPGAALFYHPPARQRLTSFEVKSPFDNTLVWQVTQALPAGSLSRRGFVHQLATTDTTSMFNGGWLLPIGQDDALIDIYSVYTQLPAIRFDDAQAASARADHSDAAQPVIVRTATHEGRTYVYLVNDAPWSASVVLQIRAPAGCTAQSLSGPQHTPQLSPSSAAHRWAVQLQPYDLVGVAFDEPNVSVLSTTVEYPEEVARNIEARLGTLQARMAALRNPVPVKWLDNPGFELVAHEVGDVPGWEVSPGGGATAQFVRQSPFEGNQSLRLSNRSGTGWIASATDSDIHTGRLFIRVAMRAPDKSQVPAVQIAMEATHNGKPYRRVTAKTTVLPEAKTTVSPEWKYFDFPVPLLPLDGLTNVRVRLEVIGAGVVEIDDVQVFDLRFDRDELTGLNKQLIWPTPYLLNDQRYAECHRILDNYWAGFLEENVPLPENRLAQKTSPLSATATTVPAASGAKTEAPTDEAEGAGFFDRVKKIFTWK